MKTVFVTVPLTMNETLNWLPSLPVLIGRSRCGGDSVTVRYSLPPGLSVSAIASSETAGR